MELKPPLQVEAGETVLDLFIRNRMRKGRDTVILVCGEQRNGKTRFALRKCWDLEGKRFDVKKQLVVNCNDFLDRFKQFKRRNIIYDEIGKDLDPYRAMDDINRAFGHVVQSQAYRGNVLWLITPFITDVAKMHRKHVRAAVQMVGRGHYILWRPYVNHADFNENKIKKEAMEEIAGIPLPPKKIEKVYAEEFEISTKEDILDQEIKRVNKKTNPLPLHHYSRPQYNVPSQQSPTVLKIQIPD